MTTAWVLGSGGLLGSALCRVLLSNGATLFSPDERFHWNNAADLALQLESAVAAFSAYLRDSERWEIYWAAGAGSMGSSKEELAAETQALALLLRLVGSDPFLMGRPGAIAYASSAGAVYAGSTDEIINEKSQVAPTTEYAHAKLAHEDMVRSFVQVNSRMSALVARMSTLYGPGQSTGKNQGLLSHIARCILRNAPIQIYVPFDTIRDYISADEAASAMIFALRGINSQQAILIKIIASEQPTTIAEIISLFKRLARRTPRIITSANKLGGLYSRRVQFRSVVVPECPRSSKVSLLVGIAQVMAVERAAFGRGSNPSTKT